MSKSALPLLHQPEFSRKYAGLFDSPAGSQLDRATKRAFLQELATVTDENDLSPDLKELVLAHALDSSSQAESR